MLARALGLLVIISVLPTQSGIAGQITLDRSWAGRLSITIGGLGGQYVDAVRIPASLHSVLDDVSDTFTIQSLVYDEIDMAGSTRVDYTHVETYPPNDFPNNQPGLITYHETFNLDRIACHISRYEDLKPSQLFYSNDGVWTSSPIFPNYDDNLFVEVGFTYSATVYETTNSFSGVIEFVFGPPLLPTFEFSPGDDYPSSLQFGAIRTIRSESKTILPTVGLPFTLTASFSSVPEPSTLSIATLAAATLAIVLRTRIAHQS